MAYEIQNLNVDLGGIADKQLRDAGVKPVNIERMGFCTKCDAEHDWWSHRKGDKGRMGGVVRLVR